MEKATFGLDENVASAACYVLGWLTGLIFFVMEKDNKTVRFHAMQSILTFLPLSILYWILGWVYAMMVFSAGFYGVGFWGILSLISLLIAIVMFLLWLFLMYKAYKGEKFLVPIVGPIAEAQVK
ncbi:MAG TPA: DUF4870 domain-containing protein [Methanoregula sp.]|nr:DUF4870 domain-containing protein [Methanoregula sp.]